MPDRPITIAHVTHEAVEKIGGIGAVLEGLITAPAYQRAVKRSILVAPLFDRAPHHDPVRRLGPHGTRVRYSGFDRYDPEGLGAVLQPIEWAFGTPIVYGSRALQADGLTGEADVLLVDVSNPDGGRLAEFKRSLHERFGVDSMRYERSWDFEEYCRLALPAWHALLAVIPPADLPAVLISHEYMGMCTALLAAADERRRFRTVFHAHECSTARRIVEDRPGHDLTFYPAMRRAMEKGRRMEDVFGDQSGYARHALVSRAGRLDLTLAVGDDTAREMRFLSHEFDRANVRVCYNGVPSRRLDGAQKRRSRDLLERWVKRAFGSVPDYLFTHVTRPVVSKGIWRDLRVCAHMERDLKARGKTALSILLTCGAPPRSTHDVDRMAAEHGWPADHREGYPDITGVEASFWRDIAIFNNPGRPGFGAIRAAIVNQFGFDRAALGAAAPDELTFDDLRVAADVEFGQSVYEPFGIAHLEPLHAGAVCVPSAVCGCVGFAHKALREIGRDADKTPNLLVADYTSRDFPSPLEITQRERDEHEEIVAAGVAKELVRRLPEGWAQRDDLLRTGQAMAERMGWDRVCEDMFLPALRSIL